MFRFPVEEVFDIAEDIKDEDQNDEEIDDEKKTDNKLEKLEEKLSQLKIRSEFFLAWTGRGFITGIRDIEIPTEIEESTDLPGDHFTLDMRTLLEKGEKESLNMKEMMSLLSFHRTRNVKKNDDTERLDRGSDNVYFIDLMNTLRKSIPSEITSKDDIQRMEVKDILSMFGALQSVFMQGDRPFIQPEETIDIPEEIPNITVKDVLNHSPLNLDEIFKFSLVEVKPDKRWNVILEIDGERIYRYIWGFSGLIVPSDYSWESFLSDVLSEEK